MKLYDIFEMTPYNIPQTDFNMSNIEHNQEMAENTIKLLGRRKAKIIKKISDTVYLCSIPRGVTMIDKKLMRVLYYVEYEIKYIKLIKTTALTQVLVWNDDTRSESFHLSGYVFTQILLPKTGVIMADSKQTWDGQRFWRRQVSTALQNGLYVYYADLKPPGELKFITSQQEFMQIINTKQPWGQAPDNLKQRFIVSTKLL